MKRTLGPSYLPCVCYLLQDVSVERFLAVAEELSDHLPTQALPLEQEVGHADGRVGDESPRNQELKALVRVSETSKTLELGWIIGHKTGAGTHDAFHL